MCIVFFEEESRIQQFIVLQRKVLRKHSAANSTLSLLMKMVDWMAVSSLLLSLSRVAAIPLLNGRFETTTDVQFLLNLALDAAAMKEATTLSSKAAIYQNVSSFSLSCPYEHR